MSMKKNILISASMALVLGLASSYMTFYFQEQRLFILNKERIDSNDKDRRQKICNEVEELQGSNPIVVAGLIQNEISSLAERRIIRWQK